MNTAPTACRHLTFLVRISYVSLLVGTSTFAMYLFSLKAGYAVEHARTMAVNTLVLFEVCYLFNTRFITSPDLTIKGLFGSRPALIAVGLVLLAQLAYTYLPPLQRLFSATDLSLTDWLLS